MHRAGSQERRGLLGREGIDVGPRFVERSDRCQWHVPPDRDTDDHAEDQHDEVDPFRRERACGEVCNESSHSTLGHIA
jgi:hypothetical protein